MTGIATSSFVGYLVGTTTTRANTGNLTRNDNTKLAELSLDNIGTGAALSPGTSYKVGAITTIKPRARIRVDVNRVDSGNAVGTIEMDTEGVINLLPLMTIPSGVTLRAHFMYFYQ